MSDTFESVFCTVLPASVLMFWWGRRNRRLLEQRLDSLSTELSVISRSHRQLLGRVHQLELLQGKPAPLSISAPSEPVVVQDVPPASVPEAVPAPPFVVEAPAVVESAPESPPFEWERWLGIRGAAVLGGVFFALAGLLFFKYSIEHGLISPTLRLILGTLVALTAIGLSEKLRASYAITANGLAGGGISILYACFWAAKSLYGLIGMEMAFGLMALTTVVGCLLAVRHESLLVAILGLVGGFSTPLLLSSGADRPFGLFGYLLLLDAGFLLVAYKRRWPVLAALSLLGTLLLQAGWILTRMGPDRLPLALGVLGVFAALFVVLLRNPSEDEGEAKRWRTVQTAALLLPFTFALYFAGNAQLGPHLYPLALLMFFLGAAATWVSKRNDTPTLASSAAIASVAVVGVFIVRTSFHAELAWEVALCAAGLSLAFQQVRRAGLIAVIGLFACTSLAAFREGSTLWPWFTAWMALTTVWFVHSLYSGFEKHVTWAAAALGLSLWTHAFLGFDSHNAPSRGMVTAAWIGIALAFHGVSLLSHEPAALRFRTWATALLSVLLSGALLTFLRGDPPDSVPLFFGATVVLMLTGLLAMTRGQNGRILLWLTGGIGTLQSLWDIYSRHESVPPGTVFAWQLITLLLASGWVITFPRPFLETKWPWRASALSFIFWFPSLLSQYRRAFGVETQGLLPLLLGAFCLGAVIRATRLWEDEENPVRRSATVWWAAMGLGFLSVTIPLQLSNEWVTVGWAMEGWAVLLLWRRLDHPGLKYFAWALHAAVAVRLLLNSEVLGYHVRPPIRLFNWIAYTYGVPIAAFIGSANLLKPLEIERARPKEQTLYQRGIPVMAAFLGLCALLCTFVWLNLAIADWFSPGPDVTLRFDRMPSRDLATSLGWALYASGLLILGVNKDSSALRWASLAFFLITIGKVFFYDLSSLKDLFRVLSLLGLAISLFAVSLLYQRFVFRKKP